ncbi:MAG: hypothetical protein M0P91_03985 [Sulfuricurvum sp.]|jgi:hypothetical protein|uniref:hypothetical protein n=1 Tax=Sulfuricurvum sp. TaxID=2025608 RepID=UPI0025F5EEEF|nr:hypothetical protein [Sulfuricurvum sp.]MCK9372332.1 hypothetical protein [Sulfuricurvum sp.]
MDAISTNEGSGAGIYAMKKAMEVQSEGVLKVLESAKTDVSPLNQSSGSSLTGMGQTIDIKA